MPLSRIEASEETAREIDCEVRTLVNGAHERARKILEAQQDTLDTLAHTLLEKETIEGDELRTLIATTCRTARKQVAS